MKRVKVYMYAMYAGILTEDENGYHFEYDQDYLENPLSEDISLTLPKQKERYHSSVLFPFFDGLIPEGWLLDITRKNWKLNPNDRMEILQKACQDCIGAVSIIEIE